MIYGGTRGYVFAIDAATGDEIWRTKLSTGSFINAALAGDIAVMVQKNIVVAGCNGHVWGISKLKGEIIWHNSLSGLGNGFVSLASEDITVQYIRKEITTNSSS